MVYVVLPSLFDETNFNKFQEKYDFVVLHVIREALGAVHTPVGSAALLAPAPPPLPEAAILGLGALGRGWWF